MSHEADHISLANRNQGVLLHLLTDLPRCSEWAAVVAFYKALHIVEAIFSQDPDVRHTSLHKDRLKILKNTRRYGPLYPAFRALWSASTVARYLEDADSGRPYASFGDYLSHDRLLSDLLDRYLRPFEQMACQMLSKASRLALVRHESPADRRTSPGGD